MTATLTFAAVVADETAARDAHGDMAVDALLCQNNWPLVAARLELFDPYARRHPGVPGEHPTVQVAIRTARGARSFLYYSAPAATARDLAERYIDATRWEGAEIVAVTDDW